MEPRQRHGDKRGLLGSMLGSWHILQMGMEVVEEECDMDTGIATPLRRLATKGCGVNSKLLPKSHSSIPCVLSTSPNWLLCSDACSSQISNFTSDKKESVDPHFAGNSTSPSFSCRFLLFPKSRLFLSCLISLENVAALFLLLAPTADSEKCRNRSSPTISILSRLTS